MNKQELIGTYKRISNFCETISVNKVIQELEKLDEPQKVQVPLFVADWYEENKDDFEGALFRCIDLIPSVYENGDLSEFESWVIEGHTEPFQTLVNMHQFGYEVEKEKQYFVKIKGVACPYLNYDTINELWFYNKKIEGAYTKTKHTRKELEEAGFGEVFNSPLFEVEEVQDDSKV